MTQKFKIRLYTVLSLIAVFAIIQFMFNLQTAPGGPPQSPPQPASGNVLKPSKETAATVPEIGVIEVRSEMGQAIISGYGEVNPQFNLTLSTRISGRIESITPLFAVGKRVKAGGILGTIDSLDYEQAVALAKVNLENARVALEEEQLEGKQALNDWQLSGITTNPPSQLVLRKPQLKAAEAGFEQAKIALKQAKRDLSDTTITVPFDAIIVDRIAEPGSIVNAGSDLASVYSTEVAEIVIPLSATHWKSLPNPNSLENAPWPVTLSDIAGEYSWHGNIHRIEQHLDSTSRQRSVIVEVKAPLEQQMPLYFGTYVTAKIKGKTWDNVWKIPSTAISQKREVWFVTEQNVLANFTPQVLFQDEGQAFIQPVPGMEDALIVVRPLSSYVLNMQVKPIPESDDAN